MTIRAKTALGRRLVRAAGTEPGIPSRLPLAMPEGNRTTSGRGQGLRPNITRERAAYLLKAHLSQDLIPKAQLRYDLGPEEADQISRVIKDGAAFDVAAVLAALAGEPTYYDNGGYFHAGRKPGRTK